MGRHGPDARNVARLRHSRVAVFAALALWEVLAPRRRAHRRPAPRWPSNLGMLVVDALLVRLLVPTAAVGAALYRRAAAASGLFNCLHLRLSVGALLGFLVARSRDLRAARRVSPRAGAVAAAPHAPRRSRHRRHHRRALPSVRDPDFARASRSRWCLRSAFRRSRCSCSRSCSTPPRCSTTPTCAMPAWLDRIVRLVVVTPDMHRVHHSIVRQRDRQQFRLQSAVVGSAVRDLSPRAGGRPRRHDHRHCRCSAIRKELRLDRMLTQPFRTIRRGEDATLQGTRVPNVRPGIGRHQQNALDLDRAASTRSNGSRGSWRSTMTATRRTSARMFEPRRLLNWPTHTAAQTGASMSQRKTRGRDRRGAAVHRQGVSRKPARRPRGLHLRRAGRRRHHASGVPQFRAHRSRGSTTRCTIPKQKDAADLSDRHRLRRLHPQVLPGRRNRART